MTRGPDAARLLARALECSADRAGIALTVEESRATGWASATFVGARHQLTVAGPASETFDRWLAALPETDLPMKDHLVADLTPISVERSAGTVTATIEALTVEER